jgi:hypothetical protein
MIDPWFTNPRLEMGPDDYAPDDNESRGRWEASFDTNNSPCEWAEEECL